MKKFFIFLLLLLFTFNAFAVEANPGDTVTIPVSIQTEDSYFVGLTFAYDPEIFEFVSNHCTGPNTQFSKYKMIMYDIWNPIPSGQVGTITLRIKEDAPLGEYKIPVAIEAWTLDLDPAHVVAYIGSIEIKCPHSSTWENIVKEADYENEGFLHITCAKCGEVVGSKTIEKLTHTPSFLELLIMYLFGAK